MTPWGRLIVWDVTRQLAVEEIDSRLPYPLAVGLVVTAIGRYSTYLERFIHTADRFFMTSENVTYVVFTDRVQEVHSDVLNTSRAKLVIEVTNRGWPLNSMMRHSFIGKHKRRLSNFDFLFVTDVDMTFEEEVGREALGDLVGTLHPCFYNSQRKDFSYERDSRSTAYVPKGSGDYYFAGGVFGGCVPEVMRMAKVVEHNFMKDLEWNHTAVWHDESHLNRLLLVLVTLKLK